MACCSLAARRQDRHRLLLRQRGLVAHRAPPAPSAERPAFGLVFDVVTPKRVRYSRFLRRNRRHCEAALSNLLAVDQYGRVVQPGRVTPVNLSPEPRRPRATAGALRAVAGLTRQREELARRREARRLEAERQAGEQAEREAEEQALEREAERRLAAHGRLSRGSSTGGDRLIENARAASPAAGAGRSGSRGGSRGSTGGHASPPKSPLGAGPLVWTRSRPNTPSAEPGPILPLVE